MNSPSQKSFLLKTCASDIFMRQNVRTVARLVWLQREMLSLIYCLLFGITKTI